MMACGYGYSRGADFYYSHAGFPHSYSYNWKGLADMASGSRASLGEWPVSMTMETGRKSVLHSGPEQTRLNDGLSGGFSLSESEKSLAKVGAFAAAAYLLWRHVIK